MYLVKIGNLPTFYREIPGFSTGSSTIFTIFAYFVFNRLRKQCAVGLKYQEKLKTFTFFTGTRLYKKAFLIHPSQIHLRRFYTNGTKSSVCGDCAA